MSNKKVIYTRQLGILHPKALSKHSVMLIGSGAVGSFTALTIGKMGIPRIVVYDDDGVADHNLPNQFFKKTDLKKYKVSALKDIVEEFSDASVLAIPSKFTSTTTVHETIMIVATDSMASRKMAWEKFKRSKKARIYIEARMGAELGMVYTIVKKNGKVSKEDAKLYQGRLYSDETVPTLPCTAKTIIYNVLMLASLIARALKGVLMKDNPPRELIFNMTSLDERSFMYRR